MRVRAEDARDIELLRGFGGPDGHLTDGLVFAAGSVGGGFVESEMTRAMPEQDRERVLGSPEAGYVTGQVLYVCGGRSFG